MTQRQFMFDRYKLFRRAWDRRAAYHLARAHAGEGSDKLISALWLIGKRIPFTGEARSLGFRGIPSRW
jgi:hypothetical protein